MSSKISGGVAAVIIIIVAVLIFFFGYRKVTGGADADVTNEVINRYRNMSKQGAAANQMTHGAPPANAAGGAAKSSGQ